MQADYDLCVIGGGINGAGIARDAAGRGISVLLVEAQDLAQGTSSASTKLIHGGLRYLEQGEFKLVQESLSERRILLSVAPHLVHPMDFIMPYVGGLRPRWMIGVGLWLYDHLSGRGFLPRSSAVSFADSLIGAPLARHYHDGFKYADCWVDDSRLTVLNAVDAKRRGAEILTRTACVNLNPMTESGVWHVGLKDLPSGEEFEVSARMVVNAAGPWVRGILEGSKLAHSTTPNLRLVKGSHIIVPRLFDGDHAYILQQPDKRVVFAISYEGQYTLIGTTDVPFDGDAMYPHIDEAEKEYLCAAVNRFFETQITPADIVRSYSGVRALFDDGESAAQKITRDYKLDLQKFNGLPLLSVFGGKLTTYRHLACRVVDMLAGTRNSNWTRKTPLFGGNIVEKDFESFVQACVKRYDFLSPDLVTRYAKAYGTQIHVMLDGIENTRQMGRCFGEVLYELEIKYLIATEYARSAEDILWRRSKLGLHMEKKDKLALEAAMPDFVSSVLASADR